MQRSYSTESGGWNFTQNKSEEHCTGNWVIVFSYCVGIDFGLYLVILRHTGTLSLFCNNVRVYDVIKADNESSISSAR